MGASDGSQKSLTLLDDLVRPLIAYWHEPFFTDYQSI